MINEKELKEDIKILNYFKEHMLTESKHEEAFERVINLIEQVLKVEGFPKEKPMTGDDLECNCEKTTDYCNCDFSLNEGFNDALDQCKLIVARDYIHKSKLLDKEEIETTIHMTRAWQALHLELQSDILKQVKILIADAIINRQLEKIGEEK